jgi:hypothetical protein
MRCLGCGKPIPWDGKAPWMYTCPCGAHVFEEHGQLFIPDSLSRCLSALHLPGVKPSDVDLPHLDYLVGTSLHTSVLKTLFVEMIVKLGGKWMKDCEKCQSDGTLEKEQEREAHLAVEEAQRILRTR